MAWCSRTPQPQTRSNALIRAAAGILACGAFVLPGAGVASTDWPPTPADAAAVIQADLQALQRFSHAMAGVAPRIPAPDAPLPLAELSHALRLHPADPRLLLARGLSHLQRGDRGAALNDLLRAQELDPDSAAAQYHLGRAYEARGRLERAAEAYARTATLDAGGAFGRAAVWDRRAVAAPLGPDREDTLRHQGQPDAFTVVMFSLDGRADAILRDARWDYLAEGERLWFVNGLLGRVDRARPLAGDLLLPPFRPYQFRAGMDFDEVAALTGLDDFLLLDLTAAGIPGGELAYAQQLALGFKGGRLFYARSFPLPLY